MTLAAPPASAPVSRASERDDPAAARSGPRARLGPLAILALVLAAVALRAVEAERKSLWLDEFHSLSVADAESLSAVVDEIKPDFHPPLYFGTLHLVRDVDPHRQRWVSIVVGLCALLPLFSLCRESGLSRWATAAVLGAFAALPYQLQYGAELRAYAWLQLASVTMAWAAFTTRASERARFWAFVLATALGLYSHYFAFIPVLAVGAARILVRRRGVLPLWKLVLAGAVGVLLFLPWPVTVESWLFVDPAVMTRVEQSEDASGNPTQSRAIPPWTDQLDEAVLALPRTIVPQLGLLGGASAWGARAGAAIAFALLGALGLLALFRTTLGGGSGSGRAIWGALWTGAAAYGVLLFLCLYLWRRVPLQYFACAAFAWPLAAGVGVQALRSERARRAVAIALLASFALMGVSHALGRSREDVRAGVATARAEAAKLGGEVVFTALLHQPAWYPHATPWRVYAPEVDFREPMEVPDGRRPEGRVPVVVLSRKVPDEGRGAFRAEWRWIRSGRVRADFVEVDAATQVYVYVPAECAGGHQRD